MVVERCAGCEEGFFGGGAQSENVVGLREGREPVVERRVGYGEGAAAEEGCCRWDFEWEACGDWVGDLGGQGACDGVVEGED